MSNVINNNRRIAKNTLFLYLRMLLVMAVGFYTSRIVLKVLGVSDYGVYNVVGGVIGMLGYVNTLIAGGTSRFLTIALGEGDSRKLSITFSTTFVLTSCTSILVIILGETVGYWFVNNYLNIPTDRIGAMNWVYQCALFSSALTIAQTPFTASIISHEKMNIYAYMSIFDVLAKLLIVYLLLVFEFDKLKLYAILILIVNFLNIAIYRIYCVRQFEECKFSLTFSKDIFKDMFSYSSWNIIGSFSAVCINYGINIVINVLFGTLINAARGVASQVSNIIQQLYSNFQLAGQPQVMKYYAQDEYDNMFNLMCNNGKYCSLLLLCAVVPLYVFVDELLGIWLLEVPNYSSIFVRLAILYTFLRSIDEPLTVGIHAVGRMKLPNLTTAVLNTLILPISYLIYKCGGRPFWGPLLLALFVPLCMVCNFWMLKKFVAFPWKMYIHRVFLPLVYIIPTSLLIPVALHNFIPQSNIVTCLSCFLFSVIYVCGIVFFMGIPKHKRREIVELIKLKLKI